MQNGLSSKSDNFLEKVGVPTHKNDTSYKAAPSLGILDGGNLLYFLKQTSIKSLDLESQNDMNERDFSQTCK